MNRLPDALVVIDPKREHIAVKEAQRMGIPTIALIDTDSDPDMVDLPIPANDDSIRSIELMLGRIADAVAEGRAAVPEPTGPRARPQQPSGPQNRGGEGPPQHRDRGGENPPPPAPTNPKPPSGVVE